MFCSRFLFLLTFVYAEDNSLIVDTNVGKIRGVRGEYFSMFLGIPYGKVEEKNPFATATPHPHFTTPYEATDDSAICPQIVTGLVTGTIHCLRLNVYTPNDVTQEQKLPVMVFVHGGGFIEGDGAITSYSPKFLMRHNVIVVSVNYRLGPFGFLCFPNSEYSNQGLKDQILALKWIKANIKSFGGDSKNILLLGHSAGSMSADFHLLYNNDGLFNKVILQSAQAITPYANEDTNSEFISTVIYKTGTDAENNVDELITKLSNIFNIDEIIEMAKAHVFRPCIDGTFITKAPKMKNLKNIKIMAGTTTKEALFFLKENNTFYEKYDFIAELSKGFSKMADDAVDVVRDFYLDNNRKNDIIDFVSDYAFSYPTERSIRYYLENNSIVYRYLFAYEGGRNYMKIRENFTDSGTTHGDELGYLFDMPLLKNITEKDQTVINMITEMWTNFAKYGDPNPTSSTIKWNHITRGTKPYLHIDSTTELRTGPFHQRMAFWTLFYSKYGYNSKGINLGENWVLDRCNN